MIGNCGKWPWKNGSLMVTFLTPTQLSSPSMSIDAVDASGTDSGAAAASGRAMMSAVPSVVFALGSPMSFMSLRPSCSAGAPRPTHTLLAPSCAPSLSPRLTSAVSSASCRGPLASTARPACRRCGRPAGRPPSGARRRRSARPVPILMCPTAPDCPPMTTKSPSSVEPEMPTLADDHAMPADDDVVPDLHEIINFRAFADDRVLERAPVDALIGADLDVVLDDDTADLRHLEVAARRPWRSRTRPGRCARPHGGSPGRRRARASTVAPGPM